jgi:hypothetical protein
MINFISIVLVQFTGGVLERPAAENTPAQPSTHSLRGSECGAESLPRKNREHPLCTAARSA